MTDLLLIIVLLNSSMIGYFIAKWIDRILKEIKRKKA